MSRGVALGLFAAVAAMSLGGCNILKGQKKAVGEACVAAEDCESGDCADQGMVCSKPCTYNKDCGGDLVCRSKEDGPGEHCAKAIGQPPNGSCLTSGDCENGHCLTRSGDPPGSAGICSRYCQTGDDCPAGMKLCMGISDSAELKLCLPGEGTAAQPPKFGAAPKGTAPKGTAAKPKPTVPPPLTATAPTATAPPVASAVPSTTPSAAPTTTATVAGGSGPVLTAHTAGATPSTKPSSPPTVKTVPPPPKKK